MSRSPRSTRPAPYRSSWKFVWRAPASSKRRSMPSSPVYVAWRCSSRVSPPAMEFTAASMTATALDTA